MRISKQEEEILKIFSKKIDPKDPGAHNNLAVVYYNKGLVKEAVSELKKALEIEPRFTLAKNNLDYIYRTRGYYDERIERLKKSLGERPDDLKIRLELAKACKSAGDYYNALTHYSRYLRSNPYDIDALLEMGITCKAIGFCEPAIEQFKKVIRINDKMASAHKYLGEVYYNLGLFPKVIAELKKAIALDPEDAETYYFLSFAYGEEGKFGKAKEAAKKAIQLNPKYAKTEPNLSLGIYKQKGYKDFLSIPKSKIEEYPFFGHYAMGLTYKNKGLFKEALREFREAEKADPENYLIQGQIGEALLLLDENEEAIKTYSKALKYDPDSPRLANNVGIANHRLGRLDEAILWYKKAVSKDGNYAVAWNNLGVVNYHSKAPKKAFSYFKKANKINPKYPDPYLNIGLIYMCRGDYYRAEKLFRKVIKIKNEYPLASNYLGSVYLNSERLEDAIYLFKRAIEWDDNFAEAYYNLGFALSRIGKYDEALEAIKKAMELNPFYTNNKFKLGLDIYSERLDTLLARNLTKDMDIGVVSKGEIKEKSFENLFEIPKKETLSATNIEKRINKAESLLEEKRLDEALELLNKVRSLDPKNSRLLLLLGKIYREKGLLGEAKDVLSDLVPDNEEALRLLTFVYQENGEWKQAIKLAKILNKKNPKDPSPYLLFAQYLKQKKTYKKAIQLLKSFSNWENHSEILLELASFNYDIGNRKKASLYVKKSLSLSPSTKGFLLFSKLKIEEGVFEEGEKNLRKARVLDPDNKEVLRLLVRVRLVMKDYEGTIQVLKDAKRVIKADSDIALWEGKAYYKLGEFNKSVNSLKQAMSFDKRNFTAYEMLASIYFRLGKYRQAEGLWKEIIEKAEDRKAIDRAREAVESLYRLKKIIGEM